MRSLVSSCLPKNSIKANRYPWRLQRMDVNYCYIFLPRSRLNWNGNSVLLLWPQTSVSKSMYATKNNHKTVLGLERIEIGTASAPS